MMQNKRAMPFRAEVASAMLLGLSALALVGCKDKAGAAAAAPPPADVEVIVAAASDVPITNEWIGTTQGFVNAEIKARVSGYLQSQNYIDGALVKTGDLLFQIDPRPFEASLAQAKAQLAKAVADKQKSQVDVDRLTPLVAQKAVAQQELDDATAANAANAALIEAANASIEQAQLNLEFTKVVAPIDGIVGIAKAQVGDLVGPTSGVMADIATLDPIKVYFPISETEYMGARKKGEEESAKPIDQRKEVFQLFLADGSEFQYRGKFFNVGLNVGLGTGTIPIVGIFPNPGNVLRPGQYARVKAIVRDELGVILVPQRAVSELQGAFQVVVVGDDNKAHFRNVKVGERVGSNWIILDGVKAGERVVVEGLQKVREGAVVNPKPYQPPVDAPAATAPAKPSNFPRPAN